MAELHWPERLRNGELLHLAEDAGFDVLVTCDQNIPFQQNLAGRKLAFVTLGSNFWPIVRRNADEIAQAVDTATPGSYSFIDMPLPPKPRKPQRFQR